MSVPQVLGGRYRLVERLGSGGMSVVWRGHDAILDRFVAVKVLSARYAAEPGFRQRIRAEAQAAARLSHPHVANVHDFGESPSATGERIPYVVMELLSGPTLAERLAAGPMQPNVAVRVCAQVASALAAAHAQGLVHCDVKPGNIVLTPDGAKVVDFGIAAVAGQRHDSGGTVLGTPAYLAPERLGGGSVLPASDVYALGLVLYRALTGDLPWPAHSTTEILHAHAHLAPAPLPRIKGLPSEVTQVYRQCLAKNPGERPPAREVARVLAAAAGVEVPLGAADHPATLRLVAAGTDPVRRPRRRLRLAAIGATVAASAAATAAFALGPGQAGPDNIADANTNSGVGRVTPSCAPVAGTAGCAATSHAASTPAPRTARKASGEGGAASPAPAPKRTTPRGTASPSPRPTTDPSPSPSASPSPSGTAPSPDASTSDPSSQDSTGATPRGSTSTDTATPDGSGSTSDSGDQG
ncbi:MAG TPA: protein kinase [Micromonosporaceae bacterium]